MSALIDTGSTNTIILRPSLVCMLPKAKDILNLQILNGKGVTASQSTILNCIRVSSVGDIFLQKLRVWECDADHHAPFDMIFGMDGILKANMQDGRVLLSRVDEHVVSRAHHQECHLMENSKPKQVYNSPVKLGATQLEIEDNDFKAVFDGDKWTVSWFWKKELPSRKIHGVNYAIKSSDKIDFESEDMMWIEDGILVPYNAEKHGLVRAKVPLFAMKQEKKNKVRPVFDNRQLNSLIRSAPGLDSAVCDGKLRNWRHMGTHVTIIDLKKAYLQIHMTEKIQWFQVVEFIGNYYVMTRLGFGLSIGPKVVTQIMKTVFAHADFDLQGVDFYMDDITMDKSRVKPELVIQHLRKYGLVTKSPSELNGARILGLGVENRPSGVQWQRDGNLPNVPDVFTKLKLFSLCGQLTGHLSIAGWLRAVCGLIKRRVCEDTASSWDERLDEQTVETVRSIAKEIERHDLVCAVRCAKRRYSVI